jgi:regulator of cell morphogenesis and NO signaling
MKNVNDISIGEIVANDFRAASVFREAGIDFCCGGRKSLEEACNEKGIDQSDIKYKLEKLESGPKSSTHNFLEWDPVFLCDYIVNTHHRYIKKILTDIEFFTSKIASVHGGNHPELVLVADLFSQISKELTLHLKKEEEIFFPAIKESLREGTQKSKLIVTTEIEGLSAEHEFAGGAMDRINVLTSGYKVPADGCNSYHTAFRMLNEFEDDLHIHVHLENNILFPKVLQSIK